jgi:hypothetical protein
MKFTYDTKQDDRECVAFITDNGNLVIKNTDTGRFTIALCKAGQCHNQACVDVNKAARKFYPGDSITIEF